MAINHEQVQFRYIFFFEKTLDCTTLRARTCVEPTHDIVVGIINRYGKKAHCLLSLVLTDNG